MNELVINKPKFKVLVKTNRHLYDKSNNADNTKDIVQELDIESYLENHTVKLVNTTVSPGSNFVDIYTTFILEENV
jgi:hypothetical protein